MEQTPGRHNPDTKEGKKSLVTQDCREERGYAVLKPLVTPVQEHPHALGFLLPRTQKAFASDAPLALVWV